MKKTEQKKKGLVGKVFKYLFFLVAFVVLLIAVIVIYKANTSPDDVPDVFGYKPMIVLSGSMETSIRKGDLVFVKVVDTTTLKEQDVIAFRNEKDTVTTHRIVEIVFEDGKQYFKTKGDANNAEDVKLVPMEDVEGLYVGRIAKLGKFLMFMREPIGLFMVLLVILVVGLLWLYIVNVRDEKKYRKKEEKDRLEFEEFKKQKELERKKEAEKHKEKKQEK